MLLLQQQQHKNSDARPMPRQAQTPSYKSTWPLCAVNCIVAQKTSVVYHARRPHHTVHHKRCEMIRRRVNLCDGTHSAASANRRTKARRIHTTDERRPWKRTMWECVFAWHSRASSEADQFHRHADNKRNNQNNEEGKKKQWEIMCLRSSASRWLRTRIPCIVMSVSFRCCFAISRLSL